MDLVWNPEDDVAMSIDSGEEEWHRLHDIRLNGQLLGKTCALRWKFLVFLHTSQRYSFKTVFFRDFYVSVSLIKNNFLF